MKAWIDKKTYESCIPESEDAVVLDLKYAPGTGLAEVHFLSDAELEAIERKAYEAGQMNVTFKDRVMWALPYEDYKRKQEPS